MGFWVQMGPEMIVDKVEEVVKMVMEHMQTIRMCWFIASRACTVQAVSFAL